jgi:hypothetical protein
VRETFGGLGVLDGFSFPDGFKGVAAGVTAGLLLPLGFAGAVVIPPAAPTVSIDVGVELSTSGIRVTIVPSLDLEEEEEVCWSITGRAMAVRARAAMMNFRMMKGRT